MKTEFLKGLGLEQEAIDKIMAENGKDIAAEQAKTAAKENELIKANETITGLQADIKKFDGVDVDKLKSAADEWETKYNADIEAEREKVSRLSREYALKESLRGMGVTDPDYLLYKVGGVDAFQFSEDGKAVGLDEVIAPFKELSPLLFEGGPTFKSAGAHGGSGTPVSGVEKAFKEMNPELKIDN